MSFGTRNAAPGANSLLALALAAALVAVAFVTVGGVNDTVVDAGTTWTEIAITAAGAAAVVAAVLTGARARAWGAPAVGWMAALAALTGLSIAWSVAPDTSWSAANQMLAYLATFAGAAALARLVPGRWPALLGAIALTTAALSGWALLAKVFPATLAAGNEYGRVQAPFGYFNAVGIVGALGVPAWLWVAARRDRPATALLAAPALVLALSAVALSSSRSADIVSALAIGAWLAVVPRRLRTVGPLLAGVAGAAVVCGYALVTSALTADNVSPASQDSAGHTFGIVLVVVLIAAAAAGRAAARTTDGMTIAPRGRRLIVIALIALACLIPIAIVGALASSSRGLTGEVSHVWSELTSTRAVVLDNPGRVLQLGSSRPLYWHEGIIVGEHALLHGVGASGFATARERYTTDRFVAAQAHSYLVQTFADLGLIGVAITLALLVSWAIATRRTLVVDTPWRALSAPARTEREGMVALALVVVAFGIESTVDWTWYFPGVAVPVLACAGWLAGRGPVTQHIGRRRDRSSLLDRPLAAAIAAAVTAVALAGVWLQWQPLRSAQAYQAAQVAPTESQAIADARSAIAADPLAYLPRAELADLYASAGDVEAGRSELEHAIRIQPENPMTWLQLGLFERQRGNAVATANAMARVMALDHTLDYVQQTAISATNWALTVIAHDSVAKARAVDQHAHGRRRAARRQQ